MLSKRITLTVCVIILVFLPVQSLVSAQHQDFDEAEEDVSTLVSALEIVHQLLEEGLNFTLSVNHTYSGENLEFGYAAEVVRESKNVSHLAVDSTSPAKRIIDDIEGDVSSYVYLNELYIPYYDFAHDMLSFSIEHQGVVLNISSAVDIYASVEDGELDYDLLYEGLKNLEDALFNLRQMEGYYHSMDEGGAELNETVADPEELQYLINELPELIQSYRDTIDLILELYSYMPPYLSLVLPDTVHPGETFQCRGSYWDNGFVEGEEVKIEFRGEGNFTVVTDDDGFYSVDIKVPWDILGEVNLNASVTAGLYVQRNVSVVKYPTSIVLKADKTAYHRENISIQGRFVTDADVDLSEITLNATYRENFSPSSDGEIHLLYNTSEFSWSINTVEVIFDGNSTLKASTAEVQFEVSIPTQLTIEGAVYERNVSFYGNLYNTSDNNGLTEELVYLELNGIPYEDNYTGENGTYNFNLTIDDLSSGHHAVNTRYPGRAQYRESVSETLYLLLTDEGDVFIGTEPLEDDGPDDDADDNDDDDNGGMIAIMEEKWLSLSFLIFMMLILVIVYFLGKEKDVLTDKKQLKKRPKPSKQRDPLEIKDKDDLMQSYGELLREIDSREIIHVPPGRTHREIREVLQSYGDLIQEVDSRKIMQVSAGRTHREIREDTVRLFGHRDDFDIVTRIFEKASFADAGIERNELQDYNRAMSRIWRVCFQ